MEYDGAVFIDLETVVLKEELTPNLAERVGKRLEVEELMKKGFNKDWDRYFDIRIPYLIGIPESVVLDVANKIPIREGAHEFFNRLHKAGLASIIVTGGFEESIYSLARRGVYFVHAFYNRFIYRSQNGVRYVDGALRNVSADKGKTIAPLIEKFGRKNTVAIGDGINDLTMLEKTGCGIAFNPTNDKLKEIATVTVYGGDMRLLIKPIEEHFKLKI
jgi:phosphoserine phosphatase